MSIGLHYNSMLEKYIAQLVIEGFTQTYGINCTKAFAHLTKLNIRYSLMEILKKKYTWILPLTLIKGMILKNVN